LLELACPACGAANVAGERFCGDCGAALTGDQASAAQSVTLGAGSITAQGSGSERRLVSVLFADLVGFTTLSEHRDPEEVRDLLSRYFERCRTLIERYGGTVEKFIGDAVMAVWGTPVAREDDPERAVRAALALTQAVTALGEEVRMPDLRVRAGVLTGNAAVELGAEGEGMVLGDTVNTASRLQSLAKPGTVLVDDVTRRASEAAIAYEDAGAHQVKGREQPVRAWTALRVVAGAGGTRRGAGLEAPLVGRDRELTLITESFEATEREGRARMVTVLGEAGSGKSRLLWEFFKYTDGIERVVRWHQGRCLSYGEGVAYWALAEMVRARAGILEEEDAETSREKLRAAVQQHVSDEREQRLVEPRLAHLLGLEQRTAADRADLFSGWRLFFERIAAQEPVVLAFEDLQWADSGLLDFIDYLLEWSAEFPFFILALGRSELLVARPSWSATITLEPLDAAAMGSLLAGLVPGLPEEVAAQIRRRSEGIPLYAIETVRMLLDRGLVAQDGVRYIVTGDIADLEVPETLQALVASRLDNLDGVERALLQSAAVIGQSFTPATLAAVVGQSVEEVTQVLDSLVAKQLLSFVDDALSAERGQYAFLQALLRTVALSTLARRDRKSRHLAVARHLRETWGEESAEIAEVLASHYVDAVDADPEAPDADEIRALACETLADAGRRAMSLGAGGEARRHFNRAAELAEDPARRGRLLRDAGIAARQSGELEEGVKLLDTATGLLTAAGQPREAARAEGLAAAALRELGHLDEALRRLSAAYASIDDGSDDVAVADLAAQLAQFLFSHGERDQALALADTALTIADAGRLGEILLSAMTTKAIALAELGRPAESNALLTHVIKLAVEQDLGGAAGRAYYNLADNVMAEGRFAEAYDLLDAGLELARRVGDRQIERRLLAQQVIAMVALGRWDEAMARTEALRAQANDVWAAQAIVSMPMVFAARGDAIALRAMLEQTPMDSAWAVVAQGAKLAQAMILRETGRAQDAAEDALDAVLGVIQTAESGVPVVFAETVDCAFAADRDDLVAGLLDRVGALKPAQLIPLLDAEAARARGRLAAREGDVDGAAQWFRHAINLFRELATPFQLARAQLEYAELLAGLGRPDGEVEKPRDEAAGVFERLNATPWLERAGALGARVAI
jgi:class 3 adenylate cyclase/tetratricopeptide (TPR) repeat protein